MQNRNRLKGPKFFVRLTVAKQIKKYGDSVISRRMDWIPYRLESYYEEYVKRTWYTDKSLYDKTGRRVQYSQNSKHVLKVLKGTVSREKYTF
jgi:hypothetical protein